MLFFSVPTLLASVRPVLFSCQDVSSALAALIPENQFWRWKEMWSNSLRTAVFAASLIEYLSNRSLISLPRVAEILGSEHVYITDYIAKMSFLYSISQSRVERSYCVARRRLSPWFDQSREWTGESKHHWINWYLLWSYFPNNLICQMYVVSVGCQFRYIGKLWRTHQNINLCQRSVCWILHGKCSFITRAYPKYSSILLW